MLLKKGKVRKSYRYQISCKKRSSSENFYISANN